MKRYKIIYNNGFIQYKNLISADTYKTEVEPRLLILDNPKLSKTERESLKLKIKLLTGGEFFTDNSPLFEAIKTRVLELPPQQGGNKKIKIELTD